MKNNQIYRKPGWVHKVLYFILLALPVIILLQFAIGITNVVRGTRILAKVRLFEERERVFETVFWILHQRQLAPAEELNLMEFPRDNTKVAALSLEFPEIIEINLLKGENEYTTIFTAAPSAKIHDGIAKMAPSLKDTISIRPPAFGEPTCQARVGLVEIEEVEYIFTFVEKDDETILMVSDPEKLKPLLPQIFHHAESGMPLFAEYFDQYTNFAAQLKFYDKSGENSTPTEPHKGAAVMISGIHPCGSSPGG